MNISLEKLHLKDAQNLFAFERKNRTFFEELVPTRGDEYYHFDVFQKRHEDLLVEQDKGQSYFYLIKTSKGQICGRINIVDLDKTKKSGYLGYRIGKEYTGRGIASHALMLLLKVASELGINELRAKTTTNNIGSQKVLEKNGFISVEISDEPFIMNGEYVWFVSYRWTQSSDKR
ncbi:GNAT family N-acetyltransferase [Metabacillus litoralis]|uniref:GNAT family N-acetyltransferase n=1 Tax=Metabacillus litoralis TaxID=152268 RepID=UPI001CFC7A30|nr:GNAT family protein [Metabacillus litoralis]